jgi:EAL domain-containing protein (putative c-di-GMP-specific phosphodiesterase class I)
VLNYQPKINLVTCAITGVEALIRWRHPSRGVPAPQEFIQIAEDCGLIVPIGQWVLRAACEQVQTWLTDGIRFGTMAVNISAVEFRNDKFLEDICGILEDTGLEPRYLELELITNLGCRAALGWAILAPCIGRLQLTEAFFYAPRRFAGKDVASPS